MKSKRKLLEFEICSQIGTRLASEGFAHSYDEGHLYVKNNGAVTWTIFMWLGGDVLYSFSDHLFVTYEDLRQVLRSFLQDAGVQFDDRYTNISIRTYVSIYWPDSLPRRPVDYSSTAGFVEAFLTALKRAEEGCLVPYLDPGKVAYECTRFYTKWPKGMRAMESSRCLIAYGIQQDDHEKVQMGADRILQKIDHCRMEDERKFALDLRAAALAWLQMRETSQHD
jgi:hypothetical protein